MAMTRVWIVAVVGLAACGSCGDGDPPPADDAPSCTAARAPLTGEATYYAADGTGNCSFDASSDLMVAAISGPDYALAAWCGEVNPPHVSAFAKWHSASFLCATCNACRG